MDEALFLQGRIKDLAQRAYQQSYVSHSGFLSAGELGLAYEQLLGPGAASRSGSYHGVGFVVYGGWEDADRNVLFFLPDYLDEESFLAAENAGEGQMVCLEVLPVQEKFADALTHRDYLGALMNLGIERDMIGDILCDESGACIFVLRELAAYICQELLRVRHTSVRCRQIAPAACSRRPRMEQLTVNIASERLDAVLAAVYHLPRAKAQNLIEQGAVTVSGRVQSSAGRSMKAGERVSVRGYGKFVFEGETASSRKGRLFVSIRKFA